MQTIYLNEKHISKSKFLLKNFYENVFKHGENHEKIVMQNDLQIKAWWSAGRCAFSHKTTLWVKNAMRVKV